MNWSDLFIFVFWFIPRHKNPKPKQILYYYNKLLKYLHILQPFQKIMSTPMIALKNVTKNMFMI